MPVSVRNVEKEVEASVAGTHNGQEDSAGYALQDGNWWTFGGGYGWIIVDVKQPKPITSISLRATNPTAAPKAFRVECFEPDATGELLDGRLCNAKAYQHGGYSSHELTATETRGVWIRVLDIELEHVPDPEQVFPFEKHVARFWRITFLQNRGNSYTGINRLKLQTQTSVGCATLHGAPWDSDRQPIGYGVGRFKVGGTPGTLVLFGTNSVPICGIPPDNQSSGFAVVCGGFGRVGAGAVVAFTHDSFVAGRLVSNELPPDDDAWRCARLLCNILRHFSRSNRHLLLGYSATQAARLTERLGHALGASTGFCVTYRGDDTSAQHLNEHTLGQCSAVIVQAGRADMVCSDVDPRIGWLRHFVERGGVVLCGMCPWGWQQVSGPTANLQNSCLLNHLTHLAGMAFTDAYAPSGEMTCAVDCPAQRFCECRSGHLGASLEALALTEDSRVDIADSSQALARDLGYLPSSLKIAAASLLENSGPPTLKMPASPMLGAPQDQKFLATLNKILQKRKNGPLYRRLYMQVYEHMIASSPLCHIAPAPDCHVFPGIVTQCPTTVPQVIEVPLASPGWQSTGCYVPPGCICYVTYHPKQKQASGSGPFSLMKRLGHKLVDDCPHTPDFRILIGCHADNLSSHEKVDRWPQIQVCCPWLPYGSDRDDTRSTPELLTIYSPRYGHRVPIASPFGGLLYLEVTNSDAFAKDDTARVEVTGVAQAPWYRRPLATLLPSDVRLREFSETERSAPHEHHMPQSWVDNVAQSRAPWGEIEGHFVIFSLPIETLQLLNDPAEMIEYWDNIIRLELQLCHQTLRRKERLVCDKQISAGYMHAGYPVMTHLDVCSPPKDTTNALPELLDVPALQKNGCWGVFHEFGHNRQDSAWTFSGAGEVTVNIFSLYCCYKTLSQRPYQTEWFQNQIKDCIKYLTTPEESFESTWMTSPGVALGVYAAYLQRYGFAAMSKVFSEYQRLQLHPHSDLEKRTQWVIQTSLAAGYNLLDYYHQWKWPVNDDRVRHSCGHLPSDDHWKTLVDDLRRALSHHRS